MSNAKQETIAEIVREMRKDMPSVIDAKVILRNYADRLEAALKRMADSIHRAMVIIAGIEMENSDYPPRLWTALEDAYEALSDALGTDGDISADMEEVKAIGRYFVIKSYGNAAKMRAALEDAEKVLDDSSHSMYGIPPHMNDLLARIRAALSAPQRNCDLYRTKKELDAAYEKYREYVIMSNSNPFVAKDEMMTKEEWLFAEAKGE